MLGVGGYEGGYRLYMSALSKNDLDALQKITGNPNITWKEYKLSRFKAVEDNLDRIPYFDAETVIEQFQAAFEKDAQNGTRGFQFAQQIYPAYRGASYRWRGSKAGLRSPCVLLPLLLRTGCEEQLPEHRLLLYFHWGISFSQ